MPVFRPDWNALLPSPRKRLTPHPQNPRKRVDVAIAVVVRDGRILVCQRPSDDPLGGYWELPGGKRESHETNEQCLVREVLEELAITVRPVEPLPIIEHDYPHVLVRLHPYRCEHVSGEPQPLAADRVEWAAAAELPRYRFLPANHDLIRSLSEFLANSESTSPDG